MTEDEFTLVECHGGPWDGRRIVERGQRLPVTSVLGPDGTLQDLRRESGYYERRTEGYYWRPAVS
jgi:hypothetical protein